MSTRQQKAPRVPKYRHHKGTNQGYAVLNGQSIYFGRYDREESYKKYLATVAEWLANDRRLPVSPHEITTVELCAAYLDHAESYYRKPGGSLTSTMNAVRAAIRALKGLYGHERAAEFGPLKLRTLREAWIDAGFTRKTCNDYTARVRHIFKWAVSREMAPVEVYQSLVAVEGLRRGRTDAKETNRVRPVPEDHIQAIQGLVSAVVWDVIQLQLLTAARPGELLTLRREDIDASGDVWTACPAYHKTSYAEKDRLIFFGPKAQQILRPYMLRPDDAYLFSPREAVAQDRAAKAAQGSFRRSGQASTDRETNRTLKDYFATEAYGRAIRRACEKVGIPHWTPHQLRHNAATRLRKEYGLEVASLMLGHSKCDVTEVYAEKNYERAREIAAKTGLNLLQPTKELQ